MDSKYQDFLVSIHCMTFNHAPFIKDTMDGFCMQQTTFPYVAIIIDDASTDGEPEVIRSYLNTHFNMAEAREWETDDALYLYARHKENKNCYFAVILLKYNFYSIKKAKAPLYREFEEHAKYIALCEGDDYWITIDKLERQLRILNNHPECAFCVTDYKEYNEYNKSYQPHCFKVNKNIEGGIILLSMYDYLNRGFFTKTLTAVYHKEALENSKFHFYQAQYDMPMFYALFTQGKGAFINEKMGVYRLSDAGITSPIHRALFIDTQLPRLFSIIQVEKTKDSKLFVYNFMTRYIIYVVSKQQFNVIRNCLLYLSPMLNIKLFMIKFPQQLFSIIKNKLYYLNDK